MSEILFPPGFVASIEDNLCSAPIPHAEYERLIAGMDQVILPMLWGIMSSLVPCGYEPLRISRHGGLASIIVRRKQPEASAWLYFQIHRNPGQAHADESVFWMYAVHHPGGTSFGRPGYLKTAVEPAGVEGVTRVFVDACTALSSGQNPSGRAFIQNQGTGGDLKRSPTGKVRAAFAPA